MAKHERASGGATGRSGKTPALVRYPKATNALRTIIPEVVMEDPDYHRRHHYVPLAFLDRSENSRRSPSERSKPSPGAMRLLAAVAGSMDVEQIRPAASASRELPRLEPVTLADGASLGEVIRIRRQMKKLSQQGLADLAGVGRRFIGELEAGKPTVELGKALAACEVLGLVLTVKTSDAR